MTIDHTKEYSIVVHAIAKNGITELKMKGAGSL